MPSPPGKVGGLRGAQTPNDVTACPIFVFVSFPWRSPSFANFGFVVYFMANGVGIIPKYGLEVDSCWFWDVENYFYL